jgi:hypothetical protein
MIKRLKPYQITLAVGLLAVLVLAGCNMPKKVTAEDGDLMATIARQTVVAKLTQTLGEGQDSPTATAETPEATQDDTSGDEATSTPTLTQTSPSPATNTPIPCNWAQFVSDVNYEDGTEVVAGKNFTKTWRLKNIGTCTWTSGYSLIFNSGDRMGAPDSTQITSGTVAPGATVDVSVDLTAPTSPGTYRGHFMLKSPDNIVFGIGGGASSYFWVEIEVVAATSTATATHTATLTPTATHTTAPPTPDFTLSYENVHNCGGANPYATTRVDNVGGVAFESVEIKIEDITASTTLYGPSSSNTPYLSSSGGCPPGASALSPGSMAYIAAYIGATPTSGNTARETLKMCTGDGLTGDCVTKTVDFVLP